MFYNVASIFSTGGFHAYCSNINGIWSENVKLYVYINYWYYLEHFFKLKNYWGTWVGQSVERWTLVFGLGHDFRVM